MIHKADEPPLDDLRAILDQCSLLEEEGEYAKVLALCDRLMADKSGKIDKYALQQKRGTLLNKLGRYAEAKQVFRDHLLGMRSSGFPIADAPTMHSWLVAHYGGDKKRAMDAFCALDEAGASRLLGTEE
jgi:hypothetical protein